MTSTFTLSDMLLSELDPACRADVPDGRETFVHFNTRPITADFDDFFPPASPVASQTFPLASSLPGTPRRTLAQHQNEQHDDLDNIDLFNGAYDDADDTAELAPNFYENDGGGDDGASMLMGLGEFVVYSPLAPHIATPPRKSIVPKRARTTRNVLKTLTLRTGEHDPWPIRNIMLRGNKFTAAKLLLVLSHRWLAAKPVLTSLTFAQHYALAFHGEAADANIPEEVMTFYKGSMIRYALYDARGEFVLIDTDCRIEATILDQQFYWACRQRTHHAKLLEKWGGTPQHAAGVFTSPTKLLSHVYAEAAIRTRITTDLTLATKLNTLRATQPGTKYKRDDLLGLPRSSSQITKQIFDLAPSPRATKPALFATFELIEVPKKGDDDDDDAADEPVQSAPVVTKPAPSRKRRAIAVSFTPTPETRLVKRSAKNLLDPATTEASEQDDLLTLRVNNIYGLASVSAASDEELAAQMFDTSHAAFDRLERPVSSQ